jgi:acyl-CoA reductase-like NAD-dependent aldehyde dehydrogenase
VFSNVNHTMALMREESFGPIIGIQKVTDDDEAVTADERHALRPHGRRVHAR